MKHSFLLYLSILAIVGCAQQQPAPSATAIGPITPTSYAAGSAANTTTAFDGTWTGGQVRNMSAGSALPGGGERLLKLPELHRPAFDHRQRARTARRSQYQIPRIRNATRRAGDANRRWSEI